mgnify:CR=1 FL=1
MTAPQLTQVGGRLCCTRGVRHSALPYGWWALRCSVASDAPVHVLYRYRYGMVDPKRVGGRHHTSLALAQHAAKHHLNTFFPLGWALPLYTHARCCSWCT